MAVRQGTKHGLVGMQASMKLTREQVEGFAGAAQSFLETMLLLQKQRGACLAALCEVLSPSCCCIWLCSACLSRGAWAASTLQLERCRSARLPCLRHNAVTLLPHATASATPALGCMPPGNDQRSDMLGRMLGSCHRAVSAAP